jgi:hypothetical protein
VRQPFGKHAALAFGKSLERVLKMNVCAAALQQIDDVLPQCFIAFVAPAYLLRLFFLQVTSPGTAGAL